MHPKERKILQRKFARGLELILSSLNSWPARPRAEPSTELRDATCPSLFFIMKENFIYMCLTHFHLRCLLSYRLISLGFRSIILEDLGTLFSVVILSIILP